MQIENDSQQEIEKFIQPDESLFDLICQLLPFQLKTNDEIFNEIFLNYQIQDKEFIEIWHNTNYEKHVLINKIVTEFLMNQVNADQLSNWEILYIDTAFNFNVQHIYQQLQEKLPKNQNQLIETLLRKIHYGRAYDIQELCSQLKAIPHILNTNKQIKLIIIDSLSTLEFDDRVIHQKRFNNQRPSGGNGGFYQEISAQLINLIYQIKKQFKVSILITKNDYYKNKELVNYDSYQGKFQVSDKIVQVLKQPIFQDSYCYYLIGSDGLNEKTFRKIDEKDVNFVVRKISQKIQLECYRFNKEQQFNLIKSIECNYQELKKDY